MPELVPIDPSTQTPDSPPDAKPKGRRGAPLGNQNAFRHGFYARELGTISPQKFDQHELRNLMGEIAMLKDYMYKIYTLNLESTDSDTLSITLRGLALASLAISRLMLTHVHCRLSSNGTSTLHEVLDTLDAMT